MDQWQRKPEWLKIKNRTTEDYQKVSDIIQRLSLHTVCREAACPNQRECFSRRTATFMILGSVCTRNCTFCNVTSGQPEPVDPIEPEHVGKAVFELGLKHMVITSVTRDDLDDGGASQFVKVIQAIKQEVPSTTIEVLIPDFKGNLESLKMVVMANPHIINHNIETVPRLYPQVRPQAYYARSLELLARVKELEPAIFTKSGIMVGLGEGEHEVLEAFEDLRVVGCDFLTVGQYLAPSKRHHPVVEYVHPDIFAHFKKEALKIGFLHVSSGPLVRSSYMAEEALSKSGKLMVERG